MFINKRDNRHAIRRRFSCVADVQRIPSFDFWDLLKLPLRFTPSPAYALACTALHHERGLIAQMWRFSRSRAGSQGSILKWRCAHAGRMGSDLLRITASECWLNAAGME